MLRPKLHEQLQPDQIDALIGHFLDKLIDRLVKENKLTDAKAAEIKQPGSETRKTLIKEVRLAISDDAGFTLERVRDEKFLAKLLFNCQIALTLEKNMSPEKGSGLEKLRMIMDKIKEKKITQPQDLEKILNPDEIKFLKEMLLKSKKEMESFIKAPRPEPKSEKEEENTILTNWLGLLTNATGGFAATVTCVIGNYYGLNDWNPNSGLAPVDAQNRVDDNAFGDPQGFNARAIINYAAQGAPGDEELLLAEQIQTLASGADEAVPASSPNLKPR